MTQILFVDREIGFTKFEIEYVWSQKPEIFGRKKKFFLRIFHTFSESNLILGLRTGAHRSGP